MRRSPQIIEILKATLKRLEEAEERDTPAMQELRRSLTRAVAELQLAKGKAAE